MKHDRGDGCFMFRYQCDAIGCDRLFTRRRYFLMHREKKHGISSEDTGLMLDEFLNANLRLDAVEDWSSYVLQHFNLTRDLFKIPAPYFC